MFGFLVHLNLEFDCCMYENLLFHAFCFSSFDCSVQLHGESFDKCILFLLLHFWGALIFSWVDVQDRVVFSFSFFGFCLHRFVGFPLQFPPFGQGQGSDPTPISSALVSELASNLHANLNANNYAAEEPLPDVTMAAVAPVNLSTASWDSSSSDTDRRSSSRGSTLQRKDSFYESDDEMRTPRRASPRKAKAQPEEPPPSYENAIKVTSEPSPPVAPPLPSRELRSPATSYENVNAADLRANVPAQPPPQAEGPALPSYEEAVFGSGEADGAGEAPPVPPRAESQMTSAALTVDVAAANLAVERVVTERSGPDQVPGCASVGGKVVRPCVCLGDSV